MSEPEEAANGPTPPVVCFTLQAWPNEVCNLRAGDIVIIDPTWGVLEVLAVKIDGDRASVLVRPKVRMAVGQVRRYPTMTVETRADRLAFRQPDNVEW